MCHSIMAKQGGLITTESKRGWIGEADNVVVHEHLYQAIAIGVRALIGFLSASRSTCNRD